MAPDAVVLRTSVVVTTAQKMPCVLLGYKHSLAARPTLGHDATYKMHVMPFDALMTEALAEARRARDAGEVPIGAVVALDGAIVGRGFNQPISSGDPTAHAEIIAIRNAAAAVRNYRLTGAVVCVTIEPCLMCVGALVHARIGTLVYGALEPRSGAVISTVRGGELPGHNHRFEVVSGVCEAECRALMQTFFRDRRVQR